MDIGTFMRQLEDIETSEDLWNPDVYIRIGLHQVKVSKIEYCPEMDDEEEAIIIS